MRQGNGQYLTVKGTCPKCGEACSANLFANEMKKPGEKSPDFREPKAKPPVNGGNPQPVKAARPVTDDDFPF